MYKVLLKKNEDKRKLRVRKKVFGAEDRPRLSVFRSSKYIYAQIINDTLGTTLVDVSESVKKLHEGKSGMSAAFEVGKLLAEKALIAGVKQVVFDKGSYKYHGRVKSLAEGARAGGLGF